MLVHIEGVQAERDLRANPFGDDPPLSIDQYYDLVLAATGGDARRAERQAKALRWARIRESGGGEG